MLHVVFDNIYDMRFAIITLMWTGDNELKSENNIIKFTGHIMVFYWDDAHTHTVV